MSDLDQEKTNVDPPVIEEMEGESLPAEDGLAEPEASLEQNEERGEETGVDEDLEGQVEKWKDVAARAQADLDNYRKRMARERSEAIQYANRSLLEQLLPIIDNFEMGLNAAKDADGEDSMIFKGMVMVHKQIDDFLSEHGLEKIESDGLLFDPNVHEALKQEPSEDIPENHIMYTLRRGYRLKDRVIRAANVVVSSGPGDSE